MPNLYLVSWILNMISDAIIWMNVENNFIHVLLGPLLMMSLLGRLCLFSGTYKASTSQPEVTCSESCFPRDNSVTGEFCISIVYSWRFYFNQLLLLLLSFDDSHFPWIWYEHEWWFCLVLFISILKQSKLKKKKIIDL